MRLQMRLEILHPAELTIHILRRTDHALEHGSAIPQARARQHVLLRHCRAPALALEHRVPEAGVA
jgi:hypothetical protein